MNTKCSNSGEHKSRFRLRVFEGVDDRSTTQEYSVLEESMLEFLWMIQLSWQTLSGYSRVLGLEYFTGYSQYQTEHFCGWYLRYSGVLSSFDKRWSRYPEMLASVRLAADEQRIHSGLPSILRSTCSQILLNTCGVLWVEITWNTIPPGAWLFYNLAQWNLSRSLRPTMTWLRPPCPAPRSSNRTGTS